MKKIIYILGIVTLFLAGCYDDKGNYDYKEVNDLTIAFTPEATSEGEDYSYSYQYRQPPLDSLKVTYIPVISQTTKDAVDNLEFLWTVSRTVDGKKVIDSVYMKELLLKYPPRKASLYEVVFKVKDVSTQIEYYRQLNMKTVVPFVRSWFVLNGPQGDRRLSVIEDPNEEETAQITLDVYQDLWGARRFQKAERIMYAPDQSLDYRRGAALSVVQPDSVSWLYAFEMLDYKPSRILFPSGFSQKFAYGVANNVWRNSVVVDQNGKFYHAGSTGFYYTVKTQPDVENYTVDKMYMSTNGFVTVWDKKNKKFMYYELNQNSCYREDGTIYPSNDDGNTALLTLVPNGSLDENEWEKNEVLWVGQGISPASEESGALVIGKNTATSIYNMYHFEAGKDKDGDGGVSIKKVELGSLDVDANSCFATSVAYADQFFYTKESKVYLYNSVSKEAIELYDAGGVIHQMQFRVCSSHYNVTNENRSIGIVVNKADGTGELHEIFLDEAGDFVKAIVHTGFGTIQDIAYSFVTGNI